MPSITPAQRVMLTAVVKDADGNVFDPPPHPITWVSNNEAVATVDPDDAHGSTWCRGVAQGTADITATCGDLSSAPFTVTVVDAATVEVVASQIIPQ